MDSRWGVAILLLTVFCTVLISTSQAHGIEEPRPKCKPGARGCRDNTSQALAGELRGPICNPWGCDDPPPDWHKQGSGCKTSLWWLLPWCWFGNRLSERQGYDRVTEGLSQAIDNVNDVIDAKLLEDSRKKIKDSRKVKKARGKKASAGKPSFYADDSDVPDEDSVKKQPDDEFMQEIEKLYDISEDLEGVMILEMQKKKKTSPRAGYRIIHGG